MIKIFTCFLSTMFTTSLLFMAMVSSAIAQEKIKLGAVLPLTEITGKDASRSMQLAVKQINAAGGLLGKQVELIIVDDEMKPDKAVAAVEKLVNTDKVDIIVGGTNNAITMEVIPVLKKYQKVTVWTGASSAKVEQALEGQDWFFHLHAWDYQLGAYHEKIWREIVQKHPLVKKKMIFVAYKEDSFGSDIYTVGSPVAKAYLNLLGGEAYKSTADFRALLKNARIFGPNIFIWEGSEKDAIPMLEEAKNYGFAPPIYLVNSVILPVDFGKQMGSDGVMFYSYWHDSMKSRNKASNEYSAAFNNEFKEAPATYFGPLAYTNIMIVANAIKKAGSLDKVALISAMEATNYESPLGDTFAFARSLSIKQQAGAYPKLMQWQGGNAKIIWPWELATGKLIYPFPAQGFNKAPPLEEVKPPVAAPKPPAKGKDSKPVAPAKQPAPAKSKPATPEAKPATVTPAPATTPEAKPAVAVDMTGLWKLAVVTPQGAGNPEFTLKQEGNKLTGNYAGSFGEASATGTVQGRNFEIRYRLGGVTTVYKGKVDGNNKMSGDVDFGGQASGTFTGEKKPADK
jgi:branched-chain amino acid transport system substrate-binding protein